jgi:hypothetical protein
MQTDLRAAFNLFSAIGFATHQFQRLSAEIN